MNEKGFTLVEMISVLILLAIIFMIMIPGISKLLKSNNDKMNNASKEVIEDSTLDYVVEKVDVYYPDSSYIYCVSIDELITNGNITEEMISSLEDKSQIVNVTFDSNKKPIAELKATCNEVIKNVDFTLVGDKIMTIEVGSGKSYIEHGAIAKDNAGQTVTYTTTITNSKKEEVSNVNATKIDNYLIKYEAVIDGEKYFLERIVKIIDTTVPVITGSDITIYTTETSFNIYSGIKITDNSGEIIKPKVTSNILLGIEGTYYAIYTAKDSSGNTATYKRKIIIEKKKNFLKSYTFSDYDSYEDFFGYSQLIASVYFVKYVDTTSALNSWDVSKDGDSSITAWVVPNTTYVGYAENHYDLYIGSNDKIYAGEDFSYWFFQTECLNKIDFSNLDTSYTKNISYLFAKYGRNENGWNESFVTLDLSSLDLSNVTNTSHTFSMLDDLTSINLGNLGVGKIINMANMFEGCTILSSLDLTKFDTSNTTKMDYMFSSTPSLKSIKVSSKWVVGSSTTTTSMFSGCGTTAVTKS